MRLVLVFIFYCNITSAQNNFPKDYFSSPLAIPIQLSGNFGELRPNHFHAGFDFKTLQKEGLKIYAVADGYVSRIKISTFGNGKTIYITHPNGITSVYAHLQSATDSIEDFIKKRHYAVQSFEMDLNLQPGELVVTKGQVIAISGNTGASEGPHLHFEFRDSVTEYVINPLLFGFDKMMQDTKKPIISSVYVYPLNDETVVNQSKRALALNLVLQKDGTYLADKVIANGNIGFGINTFDFDNVSFSRNGVYNVRTFYNGVLNFEYQFDTYSFDEMRYINALIDYSKYKKTQQRVQKLFMKNPYKHSIIKTVENRGVITVVPNLASVYRIEVADFYGNKSVVTIPIAYGEAPSVIVKEPIVSKYFIKAAKDNNFENDNKAVFFPAGTFYEDFNFNFEVKNDTLQLHDDTVPAHTNFTITIVDTKHSKEQLEKLFIATVNNKKIGYISTIRKENVFSANTKNLGKFILALDTIAPKITMSKSIGGKFLTSQKNIQLTISDATSGIKSYNGFLNGKWVLFEYDNKTKKITHNFSDGIVVEGKNELKVIVIDNVGNSTIFETHFFRSQIIKK